MWIKICGITRLSDAVAAARFGADAIGFIFAESPRRISPEEAKKISLKVKSDIARVGVFVNSPLREVERIKAKCGLDLVQLHGEESADYCLALGGEIIKAVKATSWEDIFNIPPYPCKALLLERKEAQVAESDIHYFDWKLVRFMGYEKPVIVAGGLNPANISRVIKEARPYGVDVSSGIEERPGVKSHALMYEFIERARKTEYALTAG